PGPRPPLSGGPGRPGHIVRLAGAPGDDCGRWLSLWPHRHHGHLMSLAMIVCDLMKGTFISSFLMKGTFIPVPGERESDETADKRHGERASWPGGAAVFCLDSHRNARPGVSCTRITGERETRLADERDAAVARVRASGTGGADRRGPGGA